MNIQAKAEISNLLTPIINIFKILNDEWKNLLDEGLYEYTEGQLSKYYFVNTFLHRWDKVRFNDIYYPIKSQYKHLVTDFNDLDDLCKEYQYFSIIGRAGSGKSTLVKHIFIQCLKQKSKLPILIELRNLNKLESTSLKKYLFDKILTNNVKPNAEILERALKQGQFLFILDGYDELFSESKELVRQELESFIDSYHKNSFVITSRPGSGVENLPRFYEFRVLDLEQEDIPLFIQKMQIEKEREGRIVEALAKNIDYTITSYLSNPLLLSMFILSFENHPEIPSNKSAFYRNVFDTLYSRHDGITKNSFPREKTSHLDREGFEEILMYFSYLTYFNGEYSFVEEVVIDTLKKIKQKVIHLTFKPKNVLYDLQVAISIFIKDGHEYNFPHRSMQEYFASKFISSLQPNQKQIAYDRYNLILQRSEDIGFGFWDICLELDRYCFLLFYIIPKARAFASNFSNIDNLMEFKAFSSELALSFGFTQIEQSEFNSIHPVIEEEYEIENIPFWRIFSILGFKSEIINQIKNLYAAFPKQTSSIYYKYVIDIFDLDKRPDYGKERSYIATLDEMINENLFNFLVEMDIIKNLNNFISELKEKIELKELQIIEENQSISDLLEF